MALWPVMPYARARTALGAVIRAHALRRERKEAWAIWSSVAPKLDLAMPPQPTNRMARFVRHVRKAELPRPTRYLEIGTFEGATLALVFTLLNRELRITVIDPWLSYPELADAKMAGAEQRFVRNIAAIGADPMVRIFKGRSIEHLPRLIDAGETFDFILVDGSHEALDVLVDAALAWRLLALGGLLVFDDYLYDVRHGDEVFRPKPAIDAFVRMQSEELDLLDVAGQVILRRKP